MKGARGREMEPRSNVSHVCDEHAPRPAPRYFDKPGAWFVGRIVKVGFDVQNPAHPDITCEHMWVSVEGSHGDLLRGRLDNDPFYATGLKDGDEVVFDRRLVEAVYGD